MANDTQIQLDPATMQRLGLSNPFAGTPAPEPPPSPSLGFQAWASDPRNAMKVAHAMTSPTARLQPGAGGGGMAGPAPAASPAAANQPLDMSAFDNYDKTAAAPVASSSPVAPAASPAPAVVAPAPSVAGGGAKPLDTSALDAAQQRLDADRAQQQSLQQSGAGLNKIKNPFLRVAARVGDIAAPFILGRGAMAIPGTTAHNQYLQQQQAGRVGADQQSMVDEMQQNLDRANLQKTQAETAHENAATSALQGSGPEVQKPFTVNTDKGVLQWDGNRWTPIQVNGAAAMPPARAGSTHPFQRVAGTSGGKSTFANYDPMTGKFTDVNGTPLADFEPADKSMKGTMGPFGPALVAYRMLQTAYENNPALLPFVGPFVAKILAQTGAPQAGLTSALSQVPAAQPRDDAGNPVGLRMPGAPTSQTRSRGQFAEATIPAIESAKTEITKLGDQIGPMQGRWNELYTGKVGAYGPQFSGLQTTLKNVGTAWMRLHANSESARQDFEKMLSTSKDPANLLANLNAIEKQANDYVLAGQGRPGEMNPNPYAARAATGNPYKAPAMSFKATANAPGGGVVGTNDGRTWFDVKTGKKWGQ